MLTLLVITLGFVVINLLTNEKWALYVAAGTGLAGLLFPGLREWIHILWYRLAHLLGLVVPNILLSIVFFFILFPLALLSRFFGEGDPLKLKNKKASFFKENVRTFKPGDLENPW